MKKLILFGVLIALFAGSFTLLYRHFGTKPINAISAKGTHTENYTFIDYKDIKAYSTSNPNDAVFVLVDDHEDSEYLLNSVIASISTENDGKALPHLVIVDLSKEKDLTVTRLQLQFGVETYPAFLYGNYDSKLNVFNNKSSLVYNPNSPLTSKQVKQWVFDIGLWNGPYNEN